MKAILVLLACTVANVAVAKIAPDQTRLRFDPPTQYYVTGEVVAVERLCPPGAMCFTDGTVVTLAFTLTNGCQSLEEVTVTQISENQFEVAALQSEVGEICTMNVREELKKITLNMSFPPFQLVFKGTPEIVDITEYFDGPVLFSSDYTY